MTYFIIDKELSLTVEFDNYWKEVEIILPVEVATEWRHLIELEEALVIYLRDRENISVALIKIAKKPTGIFQLFRNKVLSIVSTQEVSSELEDVFSSIMYYYFKNVIGENGAFSNILLFDKRRRK